MGTEMKALRVALGMTLVLGLGLALASCNDDGDGSSRTVFRVAKKEISQNTADTSDPIQINDLPLSDADTRDTGLPRAI
jgi:hypothetical protein